MLYITLGMIVTTATRISKVVDGHVQRDARMTRITVLRGVWESRGRTEGASMSSMRLRLGHLAVEGGRWKVEGRGEE